MRRWMQARWELALRKPETVQRNLQIKRVSFREQLDGSSRQRKCLLCMFLRNTYLGNNQVL